MFCWVFFFVVVVELRSLCLAQAGLLVSEYWTNSTWDLKNQRVRRPRWCAQDFRAHGESLLVPLLTCSSWPQDGCRSSWHRVHIGSSQERKGATRPLPCPETPDPSQLTGQSREMSPDQKQPWQKALPRTALLNLKSSPKLGTELLAANWGSTGEGVMAAGWPHRLQGPHTDARAVWGTGCASASGRTPRVG